MDETSEISFTMNDFEQRVIIRSLNEFRNILIDKNLSTEDVDHILGRITHAGNNRKRRRSRDAR